MSPNFLLKIPIFSRVIASNAQKIQNATFYLPLSVTSYKTIRFEIPPPLKSYSTKRVITAKRKNDPKFKYLLNFNSHIQGDSDVFSIKQNLNSLHQGEHRFSHAFFTKVPHFRDNRKNVQF